MAKPAAMHFEITGRDSAALKRVYATLFGWDMHETPIPGYYVVGANCKDLDEAIQWAAKIPDAARGSVELRPIVEL